MNLHKSLYPLFALMLLSIVYSCASPGNPSGGPQDKTPPIFINSHPKPNATNVNNQKLELIFDEIVTLKDPSTKIIVSPAQTEQPKITANGRKVTVEIIDTLLENTTYTVDFSNAIQDNNEGNPLYNFAFAFSTGEQIDTMRVSGIVLDSHTLEPMQGVVVGLHDDLSDSAFFKTKMKRVALTNDRGQFTIRNLKPGKYHIFGLKDLDRDYKFANPTEDIAFCDSIIIPAVEMTESADTVYNLENEIDTIIPRMKPRYLPNDILLNMFNENRMAQYMSKYSRLDSTKISVIFAAQSDTLPQLRIINKQPEPTDWYTLERSQHNDSLTYWITKPELVSSDSLRIELRSLRTDTANNLVWGTDTLNFNFQRPKPKKPEKKKKNDTVPEIPKTPHLSLGLVGGTTVEVYAPLYIETPTPIDSFSTAAFHLDIKVDTLWNEVKDFKVAFRDSTINRRTLSLRQKWEPGASYKLRIDTIGITDIYGLFTAPFEQEFSVRAIEEYGNLTFNITGLPQDTLACVELLSGSDEPILTVPVKDGRAVFLNLLPAKYYARLFIDRNGNGKYDTGNYALRLQPEETFYYPGYVNLKKNWDVEQTWDIYATPVDKQKPEAIKKNKPERKKWEEAEKKPTTEEEEDESGFNNFDDPNDPNQRRFNQQLNGSYYN